MNNKGFATVSLPPCSLHACGLQERGFAHILVLILVIIGIGVVGYYSWQNGILKTTPEYNISPTPTFVVLDNTSTGNLSVPNDWKTYKSIYKFEFKYPKDWYLTGGTENQGNGEHRTLANYDLDKFDPDPQSINWEIGLAFLAENERENFLNNRIRDYEGGLFVSNPTLNKTSEFSIGGLLTQEIAFRNSGKVTGIELIAFPNQNQIIIVSLHYPTKNETLLTKQILSTFKFYNDKETSGRICDGVASVCPTGYICQPSKIKHEDFEEIAVICVKK